jgi:hypothetical protein
MKSVSILATAVAAFLIPSITLAQDPAVWTTPTSGTLGGSSFVMSGTMSPSIAASVDFSGPDFSAGPLGIVDGLNYASADTWTVTFTPAAQSPRVYGRFWRGTQGTGVGVVYNFSQAPVLLSGFSGATLMGTTLDCPDGVFYDGILEFSGLVSSITISSDALCCSLQTLTFGVESSIGVNYCISTINSTAAASTISASGSGSISANNLVLSADNLPSQPGIFIAGPSQAQIPFFNGFLCVNSTGLQRFQNVNVPAGGVITETVDYATSASVLGSPGPLLVVAGQTYNYQRWNRDPAGGGGAANFSDGIEIAHTP